MALGVGALGIANVMLMAVLERRSEIGLRRALGATRGAIAGQFFGEALLLAGLGGLLGVLAGLAIGGAYATSQGWPVVVSPLALALGVGAAAAVGAVAGLYPAVRAASVPRPTRYGRHESAAGASALRDPRRGRLVQDPVAWGRRVNRIGSSRASPPAHADAM